MDGGEQRVLGGEDKAIYGSLSRRWPGQGVEKTAKLVSVRMCLNHALSTVDHAFVPLSGSAPIEAVSRASDLLSSAFKFQVRLEPQFCEVYIFSVQNMVHV